MIYLTIRLIEVIHMDDKSLVKDLKKQLKENSKSLYDMAIDLDKLPPDDDFVMEDEWDEIFNTK